MQGLVGVSKLVEAPPLGPRPMGIALFDAERMVAVAGDARASVSPDGPPRSFLADAGT